MQIIVNGRTAFLKENTSFEFVEENRLFSGSDGYSLTITFPLRGCSQNLAIFVLRTVLNVSRLIVHPRQRHAGEIT